jgi:hypothetical protein
LILEDSDDEKPIVDSVCKLNPSLDSLPFDWVLQEIVFPELPDVVKQRGWETYGDKDPAQCNLNSPDQGSYLQGLIGRTNLVLLGNNTSIVNVSLCLQA